MGSGYCLSLDKKTMQNEQTVNVHIYEDDIEEKKNTSNDKYRYT